MNRKIYLQSGVFDQARAKSKTLACPLPKGRACKMQQISKTSLYISILEKSVIGRICLIFCIKRLNQNEFKVNVHLNDINVILERYLAAVTIIIKTEGHLHCYLTL